MAFDFRRAESDRIQFGAVRWEVHKPDTSRTAELFNSAPSVDPFIVQDQHRVKRRVWIHARELQRETNQIGTISELTDCKVPLPSLDFKNFSK
jgi:hypothetical protein